MKLTTEYPLWFAVLCLLTGALFAGILYFRQQKSGLYNESPWAGYVLPLLRFLSVSFIAFFLLGPLLLSRQFFTEKPILLVGLDYSTSVRYWDSSTHHWYHNLEEKLEDELADKFDIEVVSFGSGINYEDKERLDEDKTRISDVMYFAGREYRNQNLAALLLVSDGIYNAGADPNLTAKQLGFPVYTIGLGDTSIRTDLRISNVLHNSIAYLGNEFPVRADIAAAKCMGRQANISCYVNGQLIQSRSVTIGSDDFYREEPFILKAGSLGNMKVQIALNVFDDEENTYNNSNTFYIDVVDSRKKIEIWSKSPHPDLGAIKSLINKNDNYQCELKLMESERSDPSKLDLVVLFDWFTSPEQLQQFEALKTAGVPVWLIIGDKFDPNQFNRGSQDLKFLYLGRSGNVVQALRNPAFEYFELNEALSENIQKWSPLRVPFGEFSGYKESDVVLYQKIGSVKTNKPLLLVQEKSGWRFACLAGTGIWQWRLLDYEANQDHELISELVQRVVQYSSVKDDKKRLRVYPSKRSFGVSEDVLLSGELFNQSFQAVSNAEINVSILDENGREIKRLMDQSGSSYLLRLQNLPAGVYTFTAKTTLGGESLEDKDYFSINEQDLERVELTANHGLLRSLSMQTGGSFINQNELDKLAEELKESTLMQAEIVEEQHLDELISKRWIFWFILVLLGGEWLIRKIIGSY